MLSLTIISLLVVTTQGFVGHDCNNHLSTTIYSAIDPPNCSPPNLQWESFSVPVVSILQTPLEDSFQVAVVQGRTRTISYYCSYERHFMPLLFPSNFLDMAPMALSPQLALSLLHSAQHGEQYQGKKLPFGKWVSYHDSNDVDSEGYCRSWSSKGSITIHAYLVENVASKVFYSSKGEPSHTMVWGERLGVIDPETPVSLSDGSVVISPHPIRSRCELELVYTGPGEYVRTKEHQLFLVVDSIATGLLIGDKTEVCGVSVSTTSATSVLVTNQTVEGKTVRKELETVHWSAYIQSIVQYEALHLTRQMAGADVVLSANQCELERMVYSNILFGARTDPDLTGLRIMGEPGWSVRVAGSAIHIFKCTPVPLKIDPKSTCFTRIPVSTANSSTILFLDPSSYSLFTNATQIECSDPQNPFFKIRGSWYKLTPDLHLVPPPNPLPSRMELLNSTRVMPVTGLYPSEVLQREESSMKYAERVDRAQIALVENYHQLSSDESEDSMSPPSVTIGLGGHVVHYLASGLVWVWLIALTLWVCYCNKKSETVSVSVSAGPEHTPLHQL